MTYQELLATEEWNTFRLTIIGRDKWTCKNCHNDWIGSLDSCDFKQSRKYNNEKAASQGLTSFVVVTSDEFGFGFNLFFWSKNQYLFEEINLNKQSKVYYDKQEDNYTLVAFKKDTEWIYVNNLHVHHTYYKEDLLPWEYPSSDLETLCWKCHENLHKNSKVPHLDREGNIKGELTPCGKCFGGGYLPIYHYHQNGICFSCNGFRYMELKMFKSSN